MNKLLVVGFLLAISSAVSGLELENLCRDLHYDYHGLRVNSVYRSLQNVELKPMSAYYLEPFNCTDNTAYVTYRDKILAFREKL